jgi:hypothetical protein
MKGSELAIVQPLIELLSNACVVAQVSPCLSHEFPALLSQQTRLQVLNRAYSRFIDSDTLSVDFSEDNKELQQILAECAAGIYSTETRDFWQPGNPMHLSHLIGAYHRVLGENA